MGVSRLYWFQTMEPDARATRARFGDFRSMPMGRKGLVTLAIYFAFSETVGNLERITILLFSSVTRVSDNKKVGPIIPTPARAVCNQKITRHEVYVTMTPPTRGPMVGPIKAPV